MADRELVLAQNHNGVVLYGVSQGCGPSHLLIDGPDGRMSLCGVKRYNEYAWFREICRACDAKRRGILRRQRLAAEAEARASAPTRIRTRREPDLCEVAELYLSAAHEAKPPTQAVRHGLGVSYGTAARLVGLARKRGLLPEGPVQRHARALAVAQALGVEYDALVDAICHLAGGSLQIRRARFIDSTSPESGDDDLYPGPETEDGDCG